MGVGRRTKLTPEVQTAILGSIRLGAYDWVAAQASGIGPRTFYRWIAAGEKYADSPYRQFWQEVCQARAHARMMAEAFVRKDNPLAWLRYGPGRERPGEPGWTESREVTGPGGEALTITVVRKAKTTDDEESDPGALPDPG